MIDKDVIESHQLKVLEKVFEEVKVEQTPPLRGILKNILCYPVEEVKFALGKLGLKIWDFSNSIDLDHPDLLKLCFGQLVGEQNGSFSRSASDLLNIASYANRSGISENILEHLHDCIISHEFHKEISTSIGSPFANLLNTRFIPKQEDRDTIRSYKEIQHVYLSSLNQSLWDTNPSDFVDYFRGSLLFQQDIDEAYDRLDHLKAFNLSCMARQVEVYIDQLKSKMTNEYCFGFNQISLVTASIILAKQVGVYFTNKAYVSRDWLSDITLYDATLADTEYTPRTYPLIKTKDTSEKIQKVVYHLEHFPELGGKPLFDHYRVLFPSFALSNSDWDIDLTKLGHTTAVLLGEKDGNHYFICYWEPQTCK